MFNKTFCFEQGNERHKREESGFLGGGNQHTLIGSSQRKQKITITWKPRKS